MNELRKFSNSKTNEVIIIETSKNITRVNMQGMKTWVLSSKEEISMKELKSSKNLSIFRCLDVLETEYKKMVTLSILSTEQREMQDIITQINRSQADTDEGIQINISEIVDQLQKALEESSDWSVVDTPV